MTIFRRTWRVVSFLPLLNQLREELRVPRPVNPPPPSPEWQARMLGVDNDEGNAVRCEP